MDLTLLTCNYNTPLLIENLIKSTKKFSFDFKEYIVDTGEKVTYDPINAHISNCSHGEAVNFAFGKIDTELLLLVDSDVIFHLDIGPIITAFNGCGATLLGNVSGDRGGKRLHPRVDPWFCLMNLKKLKEHGIKFFDPIRTKASRGTNIVYDIGSTMFEDVMSKELTVANFNGEGKYFKHYEGMSWRKGKFDPSKGDTDIDFGGTHNNKALHDYALIVEAQYLEDTKNL